MRLHAAAGDEVRFAIVVDIGPNEAVVLRDFIVDHVVPPISAAVLVVVHPLFPIKAVVVTVTPDKIVAAIAIQIDDDHRRAGMGKCPVSVTLPRLCERALFRTLIPTVAVQNVLEPIAIDISEADTVTVHERCAGLNHPRLENGLTLFSFCKTISHDGVGGAVGVHDVFRNPIAIEIAEIGPLILRETGVDQHMRRPQGPRL